MPSSPACPKHPHTRGGGVHLVPIRTFCPFAHPQATHDSHMFMAGAQICILPSTLVQLPYWQTSWEAGGSAFTKSPRRCSIA